MTRMQQRVLSFVASFIAQQGYSPSLIEIAKGCGLGAKSKGAISGHVSQLVSRGFLAREAGSWSRNLQVTPSGFASIATAGPAPAFDISTVPTATLIAELGRRAHG